MNELVEEELKFIQSIGWLKPVVLENKVKKEVEGISLFTRYGNVPKVV